MATDISVPYTRKFPDFKVNDVTERATATIDVMQQLGEKYQNLPNMELDDYVARNTALQARTKQLRALIDEIEPLLKQIDGESEELEAINSTALNTLNGLLRKKANAELLKQIPRPKNPRTKKSSPTKSSS